MREAAGLFGSLFRPRPGLGGWGRRGFFEGSEEARYPSGTFRVWGVFSSLLCIP